VAGDEDAAGGLCGVGAFEDGVDVLEAGVADDAGSGCSGLNEVIAFDLETASAGGGGALKFGEDPVCGGVDAGAGREVGLHAGKGAAVVEADELGDGRLNLGRRHLFEGGGNGGVDWSGLNRVGGLLTGGLTAEKRHHEKESGGGACKPMSQRGHVIHLVDGTK